MERSESNIIPEIKSLNVCCKPRPIPTSKQSLRSTTNTSKEEINMPSVLNRRRTLLGTAATALTAGLSALLLPGDASACHTYKSPVTGKKGCRAQKEDARSGTSSNTSSNTSQQQSTPSSNTSKQSSSGTPQVSGRVTRVSNGSQLAQALKNASAGNTIELANGNYGGSFQITNSGTKGKPILITARSRLKAVLQKPLSVRGNYVIVSGLSFKGTGVTLFGTNCRVTRCYFNGSGTAIGLEGAANAEVDHNEITRWISSGVDCDPTYDGRRGTNPRIYRNHFYSGANRNRNTAINLGQQASDQPVNVNGIVEYNLIENVNKKYKSIYCKSSGNTIRSNTIINAQGIENRHGRNNKYIGNWLQNCDAFVVSDENCLVEGNMLVNVRNGIRVMAGDISSQQVPKQGGGVPFSNRCRIIENSVDSRLKIGSTYSNWKRVLPARDTVVSGHKGRISMERQQNTKVASGNQGRAGKAAVKLRPNQVGPNSA